MRLSLSSCLGFVALVSAPAAAQSWPPDFVAQNVGTGWVRPTCLCFPDSDSNADLLVAEKSGLVWVVHNGVKQSSPVIDLTQEILDNGDRGLLAVTADPEWDTTGWIYLLYVVDPDEDGADGEQESFGRLTRYQTYRDLEGELYADPATRQVLIGATWPEGIPSLHWSHATGNLRFGNDGSLFVSTGDGAHYDLTDAGGFDPNGFGPGKFDSSEDIGAFRSQSPTSLAGKILRVDPATGLGLPDNPLYTGNPGDNQSRVWALGLRNPFRITLVPDSGSPGQLYIADVGWGEFEELDLAAVGGENFGWPCWEGPNVQPSYDSADPLGMCDDSSIFTLPFWFYHHYNSGYTGFTGQCITGLQYYTGTEYPPKYEGRLFVCEYSEDWIRSLVISNGKVTATELFATSVGSPVDMVADPVNGDLLYIGIGAKKVRRIRYTKANHPPDVVASASPGWGSSPLAVTFDASGSTDPEGQPLTFLWDFGDGATDTVPATVHTYTQDLDYTATLTVTDVGGETGSWSQYISVGNTPPVIRSINSPADGSFFTPGRTFTFDATADDAEDGAAGVPLQAVWTIDLVHDHHVHPAWARLDGLTAQWTAESHGPGTYFHVTLEVKDSRGLTDSRSIDLYDQDAVPVPHLEAVSDLTPRLRTEIQATGHLHYAGKGSAQLTFDWGDGSTRSFQVAHLQNRKPKHTYVGPGLYQLRVTASDGTVESVTGETILVRPLYPAVAIFLPVVTGHWIKYDEQQVVATGLADALRAQGYEAEIFSYADQAALATWLDGYMDDGIRDYLVCLDVGPSIGYAGEKDGSRTETWLDQGNGVLWTGYNQFARYIDADGTESYKGSGRWAADEVLDAAVARLCEGVGSLQLGPDAADLPALSAFSTTRGLITGRLNSGWAIQKLYATDGLTPPMSDALVIRNAAGGEYAQFYCKADSKLPRVAVLRDFFLTHLYAGLPKGPGRFRLQNPPDHASLAQSTGITFDWESRSGATSWLLELSKEPAFEAPIFADVLRQPSLVLGLTLDPQVRYYWRVTARSDYGWWVTDPYSFTIGGPVGQ